MPHPGMDGICSPYSVTASVLNSSCVSRSAATAHVAESASELRMLITSLRTVETGRCLLTRATCNLSVTPATAERRRRRSVRASRKNETEIRGKLRLRPCARASGVRVQAGSPLGLIPPTPRKFWGGLKNTAPSLESANKSHDGIWPAAVAWWLWLNGGCG